MRILLATLLGLAASASIEGQPPAKGPEQKERDGRRLLRCGVLALVLQLLFAFEVDPYHAEKAGGAVELPGRVLVLWSAWSGLALALVLLAWPCLVSAGPTLLAGGAVLLISCPHNAARFHALQVAFLGLATLAVALGCARGARAERVLARFALVAFVLLACEGAFSLIARSHAVGYTLAARLWFARHWSPPGNRLGYRDAEHVEDGREKLFVLGDSFVSGVGIADVRQRFPDRLQVQLGQRYQVHNLGFNGADTRYELELLETHPSRPDVLVLSYYVNDILNAAILLGHPAPPFRPYGNLGQPLAWIVPRSYLLDFGYWLLPQRDLAGEAKFLARCFTWPDVVALHEQDLQHIIDWARTNGCTMIAVVFPSLTQLDASAAWIAPALAVFARNEVSVLDVRALVRDLTPAERVVNANDSHPSARVHALVAEALRAEVEALH